MKTSLTVYWQQRNSPIGVSSTLCLGPDGPVRSLKHDEDLSTGGQEVFKRQYNNSESVGGQE